ncbi:MAG: DPP IV N-terminal domain-containing protein [Pirellulaceae bacterium]
MKWSRRLAVLALFGLHAAVALAEESLLTVAEQSDYKATSRYDDVMAFCRKLADRSPLVTLTDMGETNEGRQLPLLILADPPVTSPDKVKQPDRLVALALGNIHAGEVCGKEALMMLAREIALAEERPLLKDLVLLFAPIYNADGNERISKENRPNQYGPEQGVGIRANAQGLDLNRDHVKLESPEARALVRLIRRWDPALLIDCHTTNGSHHRYTLTYDGPRHPAIDKNLVQFTRDEFLPEVGQRVEKASGYRLFFYGNFDSTRKRWTAYPPLPRYNTQYFGLRNRLGILSEAHAYAPFKDRVLATVEFVRHCLALCAERKEPIAKMLHSAREATSQAVDAESPVEIALASTPNLFGKVKIAGYVEEDRDGQRVVTDEPCDYEVEYFGKETITRSVVRPAAYLLPPRYTAVVTNLLHHGVNVRELREDLALDVEVYCVDTVETTERAYQDHHLATVEVKARSESRRVPAGTLVIRTDQALGTLVSLLLEPHSSDGLVTWNFFDDGLVPGKDFPVLRLPTHTPMLTASLRHPEDVPQSKKPITFEALYGGHSPHLSGSPASGFRWLAGGEHFLQKKEGRYYKVHAATGRSQPFYNEERVAAALEKLEGMEAKDAKSLAGRARSQMDAAEKAALLRHGDDLYYVTLDAETARRLTDTPGSDELASFSPDGQTVAFVRDYDLYVVEVATASEHRLTYDGTDLLRNGKADWVYFEEIYHRSWRAFKWAPNSRAIVFQQFDGSPVGSFTVLNHVGSEQGVETTRYPLAGTPNPKVRLGTINVADGAIRWIDLSGYTAENMLVSHFGWTPDSEAVFYYIQDRTQQWLDFNLVTVSTGAISTLFREETEAWVDNPGDPHFLQDGTFLWLSERDGWKHLYHFAKEGTLIRRVTEGEWEVRGVSTVSETDGWIYFTGTRDSHLGSDLYRVKLDGSGLTRLTKATGSHRTTLNESGSLYVDSWSDHRTPTHVRLCRGDGEPVRMLDTNPVPALDDYVLAPVELFKIKTRDGLELEASLIKPADFDPKMKYPVWLQTYGGPHAPSLSDSWHGGRTFEQMLAQMGILAFRCDPRSASGKGAHSTWTAHRQLGVQELQDLEDALDWLAKKSFVDMSRVGLSGHSYGGFLTAFAMTHSKRFAAGIAGAPVTDWRNYDTIYTERYMGTPEDNPEGYKKTSVVEAAKDLHGRLLLIHGARDDNVHVANTLQLANALQKADKRFEMMIYPSNRHGISGVHYRRLMVDFIRRTMLGETNGTTKEANDTK